MNSGSTLSEPPFPLFATLSEGERGDFRFSFPRGLGETSRGVTGFDRKFCCFSAGLRGVSGFDTEIPFSSAGLRGVSEVSPRFSANSAGKLSFSWSLRDLAGRGNYMETWKHGNIESTRLMLSGAQFPRGLHGLHDIVGRRLVEEEGGRF